MRPYTFKLEFNIAPYVNFGVNRSTVGRYRGRTLHVYKWTLFIGAHKVLTKLEQEMEALTLKYWELHQVVDFYATEKEWVELRKSKTPWERARKYCCGLDHQWVTK